MKILALARGVQNTSPVAFTPELIKAEVSEVLRLYQTDFVREVYVRLGTPAAVLIVESDSAESARASLGVLPMVEKGLLDFEMIPLAPFPGFYRSAAGEVNPVLDHAR